jgi:hypothetical protein
MNTDKNYINLAFVFDLGKQLQIPLSTIKIIRVHPVPSVFIRVLSYSLSLTADLRYN